MNMFNEYLYLFKSVYGGKSLMRSYLNYRLKDEQLKGNVIDIGGGRGADYISFMKRSENTTFKTFDIKSGQMVDFEKDELPTEDKAYDTVLFLNVLEHIYNHQHIANEVVRITSDGGRLIGFVPFLMWYHPDHKDFFRYTNDALEIIFKKAGAKSVLIEPVQRGPFTIGCAMTLLSLPKIIRPLYFSFFYFLDYIYLFFKKSKLDKYPLGYFFIVQQ